LETPRGTELTKLVKRIDIDMYRDFDRNSSKIEYESLSLLRFLDQHCPNAKIFVPWHRGTPMGRPVSTTCMWDADALLASHLENDPTFSTAAVTWRFLRIIEDSPRDRSPPIPAVTLSQGLKRLERLTLVFTRASRNNVSPLVASLRRHPLVSLSHLTIKLDIADRNQPSICDFLRQFGKQLRFFALVLNHGIPRIGVEPFKDLLSLVPNVKELVLPLSVRAPVPMPEQYRSVEILGVSMRFNAWNPRSVYYSHFIVFIKMAIWSFPSLKIVRDLGDISLDWRSVCVHEKSCADMLLMREISVENKAGMDIRPLICKGLSPEIRGLDEPFEWPDRHGNGDVDPEA